MNTKPIGPFLGVNNRLPDFKLRIDTRQVAGNFLRAAENVDIDNSRSLRRRNGRTLVQALTGAHSFFKSGDQAFIVQENTLYAVTLDPFSMTLLKILDSDDPMSYVDHAGSIYFSNGLDSGRIEGGEVYPWGLPSPAQPTVAVIGGSLEPGWYQTAVTYVNASTGEESGCAGSTNTELTATGGLRVTLPGSTTGATHINVYVSNTNGSVPTLQTTVAVGTTSVDITLVTLDSGSIQTLYEEPMPACTSLSVHMGRLVGKVENMVVYGEPYRFGYYKPTNFIPFSTNVSVVRPNQFGTYIAADKTYWVPGDINAPADMIQDVLPYGAVPGTEFVIPYNSKVGWFGQNGVVIADTQGQAEAVMTENIDLTAPGSGISYVTGEGGYYRVVSCGWCVNVENLAATSYSNHDFTSVSDGYGTMVDGLYALTGSDDSGTAIQSTINLGRQNFGTEELKRLPNAYAGCDAAEPMELTVELPDGTSYVYPARSSGEELKIQRFDVGKGLRATWYNLTLSNTLSSDFKLASISFVPVASGRRI